MPLAVLPHPDFPLHSILLAAVRISNGLQGRSIKSATFSQYKRESVGFVTCLESRARRAVLAYLDVTVARYAVHLFQPNSRHGQLLAGNAW